MTPAPQPSPQPEIPYPCDEWVEDATYANGASRIAGYTNPITREFCLSKCESDGDCTGVEMYTDSSSEFPYKCKRFQWGNAAPQTKSGSSTYVLCSAYWIPELPADFDPLVCENGDGPTGASFTHPEEPAPSNGYCNDAWVVDAVEYNNQQRAAGVNYPGPALPYDGYIYCQDCPGGTEDCTCLDNEDPSQALACDDELSRMSFWWAKQRCMCALNSPS